MPAVLLDGSALARKIIRTELTGQFTHAGRLVVLSVGYNAASEAYIKKKAEMAKRLEVEFQRIALDDRVSTEMVLAAINPVNLDPTVSGIMVQLPLPVHLNTDAIVDYVRPEKDVDGLTSSNIVLSRILPATAEGILRLLLAYKIEIDNKRVALVGFTRLLNIPLSLYLLKHGCRVSVATKEFGLMAELRHADIVITAAGSPWLIEPTMVKPGVVVIDAGIAWRNKKLVGDVDPGVTEVASFLTPVPGGVGPMTIAGLYLNLHKLIQLSTTPIR